MADKRIAVIGGGPIGIEAALYGCSLGHDVMLFERDQIGANVAAWGFLKLFTPWCMNTTPLGLCMLGKQKRCDTPGLEHMTPECYITGAELRDTYLLPLAASPLLEGVIRDQTAVLSIGREDCTRDDDADLVDRAGSLFRLLVRDRLGGEYIEHADIVLDCSGTYGHHRWAGRGGIPAPGERTLEKKLWYTIPDCLGRDRKRFAGRHTLLMGSGLAAASALASFQRLAEEEKGTRISWAIRRPGQGLEVILRDPLPERRKLLKASLSLLKAPPSWLQFLGLRMMEKIVSDGQFHVVLGGEHGQAELAVDEVVCLVGYGPDTSIFEQLHVQQGRLTGGPIRLACESSEDPAAATPGPEALKNPEPNFYILGAKSYGANANFLLQAGHYQIRDVYRLIEESPDLDLFQHKGAASAV